MMMYGVFVAVLTVTSFAEPIPDKADSIAKAREMIRAGKLAEAAAAIAALEAAFPGDTDVKLLRTDLDAAEVAAAEKQENERRRRMFKEMKPPKSAEFDSFKVEDFRVDSGTWSFDRREGRSTSSSAKSGNIFAIADYSLAAAEPLPVIPPVGTYYVDGTTAHFIAGGVTAFMAWESEDSYEGIVKDAANTFGPGKAVRLTSAVVVPRKTANKHAVLVVLSKTPCLHTRERTEAAPAMYFESRDCVFPETCSPDELAEQFVLLGRID